MSAPAVVRCVQAFREACDAARGRRQRVGLVPTMGALHDGHAALIREAARRCSFVAVSIFVNPTQFGPSEDYQRYPRTLDADLSVCERAGAHCVFTPCVEEIYPPGEATRLHVSGLSDPLCGGWRPGHFDGVATVVAKFFALAGQCTAVFGRKDFQQLRVIERMARDLLFAIEVVGHPTVREADGLAMSSRNAYLSKEQRARAAEIPRALGAAVRAFSLGERNAGRFRALVRQPVERSFDSVDYVDLADADTLEVRHDGASVGERALLALAARLGPTRLIDNVVLGEDPAPCGEEQTS